MQSMQEPLKYADSAKVISDLGELADKMRFVNPKESERASDIRRRLILRNRDTDDWRWCYDEAKIVLESRSFHWAEI
jgi:hypothetical protein